MIVREYGEHALLVEIDDPATVPAVRAALAALPGVEDAVAGARTVLAVGGSDAVRNAVAAGEFGSVEGHDEQASVTLSVVYDGADLAEVAAEAGLTPAGVVDLHSGGEYVVRFCGFSPGFAYLDGLHERLHLPRRREPRTSVPAGSVGLAGEFTGVYPRASPGGWRLLGRTEVPLWDASSPQPALLTPGTRVRFEPR